jgi:hypothetical protein
MTPGRLAKHNIHNAKDGKRVRGTNAHNFRHLCRERKKDNSSRFALQCCCSLSADARRLTDPLRNPLLENRIDVVYIYTQWVPPGRNLMTDDVSCVDGKKSRHE